MRFSIIVLLSFFIFSGLTSCKDGKAKTGQATTKVIPQEENLIHDIPTLPNLEMRKLRNFCTYVDYIFNELPFSISQDDKSSIMANLTLIGDQSPDPISISNCAPIGREFFHVDGEIVYEADIYFSDGCYAYVFIKEDKPVYANSISDQGIMFYNNLLKQAEKVRNGGN